MRAKEITPENKTIYNVDSLLNEIEAIPKGDYNPGKDRFKLWSDDAVEYKRIMKPLPGGSGLTYVTKLKRNEIVIIILDPQNLSYYVGELHLSQTTFIPNNTWEASLISVHPKYRGRGIAKALYGLALLPKPEGLGLTLVSDSLQTPGGIRNWVSLSQISGVDVTGLAVVRKVDKTDLKKFPNIEKEYEKLMVDLLGKVGGFYHSENQYFYFYQIPVRVVGSKLENEIKKSLIKIYPTNSLVADALSETLLMAKYVGGT